MPEKLNQLITESRNPQSEQLDRLSTVDILRLINQEDQKVPQIIAEQIPSIAQAVNQIVDAFQRGGRLIYLGAGTSGRLGILDASECPPTYGTDPNQVIGLIAGGKSAVFSAVENAEDNRQAAIEDLQQIQLNQHDVVVGIAASGRTPYVLSGIECAKQTGCVTAGIACNPDSALLQQAQIAICVAVGAEVVTGSSRMKAGTAQKLVLNMLTTAAMVRSGKVYGNLMVDVQATNHKLIERQKNIVMQATGCQQQQAEQALQASNRHCKTAILMLLADLSAVQAERLLVQHQGFIRQALAFHFQQQNQ
ncbi:N-acetylmuramic acid 6-phosphate etherase [Testudinibacter sp. TR-2022]|uniref:N-acetylmuramic acid 6-phosphate etherase n=1 Tax=Testudinibacter sp. TR-2022 TaxID=2585029 RepID=UPI00111B4E11|nr:N-acetylmuramic acid 6-phosphate etherase [Testudinibacter sp. TR-2022]TNH09109.1 N-acetylmuramic acid 6-phosphate etherase [Pasteurellaceae bacterium Phil11]TNH21192.1 N-acetylmuramic acid 6-phosphate etherase [Testudinibacter sp. TR-2022]TNH26412.1 N-acetylmuramic acid 6-phosphate etherase [Testudinibacter sp. TR-2022]